MMDGSLGLELQECLWAGTRGALEGLCGKVHIVLLSVQRETEQRKCIYWVLLRPEK